jgi:hypothetical protein
MLSEAATFCINQQHLKTHIIVTWVTICRMMCFTVVPALPYTHRQNHVHCRPAAAAAGTPLCRRGCDAMSSNTREPKVPGPKTLCTTTEQCEAHAQVLLVLQTNSAALLTGTWGAVLHASQTNAHPLSLSRATQQHHQGQYTTQSGTARRLCPLCAAPLRATGVAATLLQAASTIPAACWQIDCTNVPACMPKSNHRSKESC